MSDLAYQPLDWADLPGWADDDHAAALAAYAKSAEIAGLPAAPNHGTQAATSETARAFFEHRFVPHAVTHDQASGQLTGYFEPELFAARERSARYDVPLYAPPADLVECMPSELRGANNGILTHARRTPEGLVPCWTRAEIEDGALENAAEVIAYLDDPVDAFILHVQGSGVLRFENGETVRVGYAAKNGHPYVSVGRELIDEGLFDPGTLTLEVLVDWLKADPERAPRYLNRNPSYIFFRILGDGTEVASGPEGVKGTTLTPGRSLAVDAGYHKIGLPIYVEAGTVRLGATQDSGGGLRRLMVAQDVGSAIKGPERGDIFVGTGAVAGQVAGVINDPCRFFVLLPKPAAPDSQM